jgi:hypothetical protein
MKVYTTTKIETTKEEKETVQKFIDFIDNMDDEWHELCRVLGESNMDIMFDTAAEILCMMED